MLFGLIFWSISVWASGADFLPAEPKPSYPRICSPVDFRPKLSSVKIQGDTSFCFAYSSATLIHQRTGIEPSALDLAVAFFFTEPELLNHSKAPELQLFLTQNPGTPAQLEADRYRTDITIDGPHPFWHKLEGGFELNTLLLANVRGLCLEKNLSSQDGFSKHWPQMNRQIKKALAGKSRAGPEVDAITARFRSPIADRFNTWWLRRSHRLCAHQPPPVPLVPVSFAIALNSIEFRKKVKAGKILPQDQDKVLATMDYALDNERLVAIGMDLETILAEPEGEDGDHSVAIIARRQIDKECQYLLRDTSGYECDEYAKPMSSRCQSHDVWLTESELRRSLYAAIYLR